MARTRRNWTSAEDELLRRAVRKAEEEHRPLLWRELAKAVPGRSNKDCRRRWWNSLSEGNTKGPWTEEEDERLTAAVKRHGTNWTLVSREVKSRSSDQCSSHWSHVLDPSINYCDWDEQEASLDTDLLQQVRTYGTKWAYIASIHTPTRTTLALKNRYSTLRLKREAKSRVQTQGSSSSSTEASWSRANSIETAMTSPTSQWSPHHPRSNSWGRVNDALQFGGDDMDGGGETEEDEDEGTLTPTDIPAWAHPHHRQGLKADATSMPFIQTSFANWDAWARLNGAAPSDGSHLSPVDGGAAQLSATESYFPLDPTGPLMLGARPTPSPLPSYCFFGGEDSNAMSRTSSTSQHAMYPLYDDETCRHLSSGATSPIDLTRVMTPSTGGLPLRGASISSSDAQTTGTASPALSALDGGWAAVDEPTSVPTTTSAPTSSSSSACTPTLWDTMTTPAQQQQQQFSRQSSLDGLVSPTTAANYRVSISMTCHPGQLADVVSQMRNYGSGVTFNFLADE